MSTIDFTGVEAITFDCYGTLIDWEQGILNALQPVLAPRGVETEPERLLELYARHEAELERGPYLQYREVLARALRGVCGELGVTPSPGEEREFALAIGDWPAFPDSAAALRRLQRRFRLGVITNCDRGLFALSARRLGVQFDWIVTAQDAQAYKPSHAPFELAFERIELPRERILHAAQSLYHDHVPAKERGLTTVWVDRRQGREGFGATPPASATPDLRVPDMRSLADAAGT